MQSTSPRAFQRYPELILLAALLFFAFNLAGRVILDRLAPPTAVPPPAAVEVGSQTHVEQLQEKLRRYPNNGALYAQLGLALLEQVRESSDPTLYTQAQRALDEALARDPAQLDALIGQGILALARHDFEGALAWTERVAALSPRNAANLGVRVDALVELGRYDEALAAAQELMDLKPGLPAYTRVSYLRELHGYVPEAIEAMQMAADAGAAGTEAAAWSIVQVGHLHFNSGDLAGAEQAYRAALRDRPGYLHAEAGLARVLAARGQHEQAIAAYHPIVERLPLPEFVIALGELYEITGRPAEAARQYELVRAIQQLNAGAGMNVDMELALFNAEHGDPAQALTEARAAYAQRPSLHAADVLAWALYQNGQIEEARRYSAEALRLGTRDALLHYHAGKIALAAGDQEAAHHHLTEALAINPYFSLRHAPDAQRLLEMMER